MSRENCVNVLAKTLNDDTQLAQQVEQAIHEHTAGNTAAYKNEIRSKVANLKSNQEFHDAVLSGGISPDQVADMSPQQMATKEQQREYRQLERSAIREHIGVDAMQPQTESKETELDTGVVRNTGQAGIEYDAPQAAG
ncbi:Transcription elongation factor A protein 1 [Savitreella phatthalungensis]